ncbi:MAG TPA: cytochrome P450, partial [Acidimicrobiales bacterium]|nr:cytochrome P450 [Acidimicrobiales bacterium]
EPVVLFYAAANRDPSSYPDPSSFNPRRSDRRHLGFGHGPHHCLGKQLSVLAGATVLAELAALDCTLVRTGQPAWGDELPFCTLTSLPVAVGARS